MRYITLILCALLSLGTAIAQPDWVKKASKSVITIKTFNADGTLIGSCNGFFVGENGEALCSFKPFVGASKAVAFNSKGKEMTVECLMGANETFDVAKLRISGKGIVPLSIASATPSAGSSLWVLPYTAGKKLTGSKTTIDKVEAFNDEYSYYTLSLTPETGLLSSPVFNDAGEVVALMQEGSSDAGDKSYAVDARFANSLKISGLSINDKAFKKTDMKIDLPESVEQAILTLYIAAQIKDSTSYATVIGDFISKFPDAPDGYVARAQLYARDNKFARADEEMKKALDVAKKKDDVHFQYSRLIFNKLLTKADIPFDAWTFDRAAEEAEHAYTDNPIATYLQQKAEIRFAEKHYADASAIYDRLIADGHRSADIFFEAARCKQMQNDTTAMLALMDSTVAMFNKPYLKEAAPYILARAQALVSAGKYRQAVLDYNEYEKLLPTQVNDRFYYLRAQAEINGRLYQQAINDLTRAASIARGSTFYLSEKASLEVRVGLYDEAMITAQECIATDPNISDGYLFLGLAQCLKGNKTEGKANLEKAKALGDTQAQGLIDKYAK